MQVLPLNTEKPKNKGGRPKKYTKQYIDELADRMAEWFGIQLNQPVNQKDFESNKNILLKKFAVLNGFSEQRISEFAAKNEKFSEVLKVVKDVQWVKVADGLTEGGNKTTGYIFLGKQFGMRDRQEAGDNELTPEETEKLKQFARGQVRANA
jgi:hypothetical protein